MNIDGKSRVYDDDVPKQAEEAYDEIADWYSARKTGSYEFKMQLPAILNLLGDLRGKSLIDIGCGPGAYSVEFAKRGADVLGVDISRKMLVKARNTAKMTDRKFTLQKADAHSLPYTDDSFDVAVLILTILNSKMVEEAARVLKLGGLLLFSDTHPIIESKGRWEGDDIGAGRIVEDYFLQNKREWRIEPGPGRTITLKYYARTIEQCVDMIVDAGFRILRIVEPKPGEDVRKSDPAHYYRCSRVPFFIIYLAERRARNKRRPANPSRNTDTCQEGKGKGNRKAFRTIGVNDILDTRNCARNTKVTKRLHFRFLTCSLSRAKG